jgi:hypothetical protein
LLYTLAACHWTQFWSLTVTLHRSRHVSMVVLLPSNRQPDVPAARLNSQRFPGMYRSSRCCRETDKSDVPATNCNTELFPGMSHFCQQTNSLTFRTLDIITTLSTYVLMVVLLPGDWQPHVPTTRSINQRFPQKCPTRQSVCDAHYGCSQLTSIHRRH